MADQEHNSQNKNSCMLTPADFAALASKDDGYFNQKGARHYTMSNYTDAVQYYHIAAAMGNCDAISNLGYCYLYGRNMEQNTSLALAYFRIAASHGHIDALYKLGDIYSRDTWVTKDVELSTYYYLKAANFIVDQNWGTNPEVILAYTELQDYPSLCFALGRELLPNGTLFTNVEAAYLFLKHAEQGYQTFITNGQTMYEKSYKHVQELLAQSQFNDFRKKYSDVQE
ncbi:tetratricopeptide repeat protein [Eggerthellaceae bacterium PR-HUZ602407-17]